MSIKIVASSPAALELAKNPEAVKTKRVSYPFEDLEAGQSFTIPKADANVASLRVIASRKSQKDKKFVVIEHESPACV